MAPPPSQVERDGGGQGCFEGFWGDISRDVKVIFDPIDSSKVLQQVQNFQKKWVWEQQSGGKLGRGHESL